VVPLGARPDRGNEAVTATAVTWPELVYEAQMSGRLPVVIPTGSYPLVGYFDPLPRYEIPFALACYSNDPVVRVHAICAALMSARADAGVGF
jgi:hypothetical protein